MTATSERTDTERRGASELARPMLVAAAGVLAVQTAQLVVSALFSVSSGSFPDPLLYLASIGEQIAFSQLPFALGVFLTLWLVRPVSARSSVWLVIGSGAITAVGGGILLCISRLIQQVMISPDYSLMGRVPGVNPLYSVGAAIDATVTAVPLVVLTTVLLWLYLRRRAQ